MENKDCIFCKIVNDKDIKKTYEDKNFIAFPDANPRVDGHTLIIPKKHYRNLLDLPVSLGNELLEPPFSISIYTE